jgi:hypothetical protein
VQTLAGDAVGKGDWSVDMVFIYAGSVSERLQGRLGLRSTTNKLSLKRKFDQRNSRMERKFDQRNSREIYYCILL